MNVYLDLETLPAQSPDAIAELKRQAEEEKAAIRPPSNYKDEAKIAEYVAAKQAEIDADADDRYRKTSFDGAAGQICVIGVAFDDEPPVTFWSKDWAGTERQIMGDFFEELKYRFEPSRDRRPVFIGHNLVGFDLRFLFQRSVMLGIRPPVWMPVNPRPWDDSVFDTMTAWAGFGNRVSLDKLCRSFGIATKGSEIGEEIDGSKVWDFVQAGRISDVAKYCAGDIERTREIHKRLTFQSVQPLRAAA